MKISSDYLDKCEDFVNCSLENMAGAMELLDELRDTLDDSQMIAFDRAAAEMSNAILNFAGALLVLRLEGRFPNLLHIWEESEQGDPDRPVSHN
jgi:hypothetical protein